MPREATRCADESITRDAAGMSSSKTSAQRAVAGEVWAGRFIFAWGVDPQLGSAAAVNWRPEKAAAVCH
jgi:hypothetical protein